VNVRLVMQFPACAAPREDGEGSRVGAAPPSRAQRHAEPWLSGFIMLVKVQAEAKKPKTVIRAGRQQHQKLLHDALVEVCQNPQLRAHFRYRFSKFLNPLVLVLLLCRCHSPPALKNRKDQIKLNLGTRSCQDGTGLEGRAGRGMLFMPFVLLNTLTILC